MIELIVIDNPFEPRIKERHKVDYRKGASVADYYAGDLDEPMFIMNGAVVENPMLVVPPDNTQIIVTIRIEGGGLKSILGFVLTIGLVVATSGILGGGLSSWGSFFAKGMLGSYLAAGAVMYLGGRLISAVVPNAVNTNLSTTRDESQTYTWSLPTPSQAEGSIVGETYGTCIPAPKILSQHVETINGQQYLNLLLCGGMGEVDSISNIRIGYTDIGAYTGVTIETRLGTNDQEPISFFDDTPVDQGVELILDNYPLTQTITSKNATALEVTFQWPGGLYYVNDSSNIETVVVHIRLEYRLVGEIDWRVWNASWNVEGAQTSCLTQSTKTKDLPQGQYQVRATLVSKTHGNTVIGSSSVRSSTVTKWTTLTSYDSHKYSRPGKVLVALKILATNQLSGSVPSINWRQTRSRVYVYDWDVGDYVAKEATNPIWAAYDILHQCRYLKNIAFQRMEYVVEGVPKERFKACWDQWKEAAAYSDELVLNENGEYEKRFMFDAFFDTAQKRLVAAQKAATVGHAVILARGSDIGIVVDKPGNICQIFGEGRTKLSSVKGYFTSREDRAKTVEVRYNDQNNDYINTQFLMRSPNWLTSQEFDDNAASLTLFGVSRKSQAYREGIHQLAQNERQLQFAELTADVDAMVSEYGDVIGFAHTNAQIGIASGRIKNASGSTITLDREVELSSDRTYQIIIQRFDDKIIKRDVVSEDGTFSVLTLMSPLSSSEMPKPYDSYCFGEADKVVKPFRIVGVSRTSDLMVTLKLAEYDSAMYVDTLDYQAYPVVDYTPPPKAQAPINVSAAECSYLRRDGINVCTVELSWTLPRGARSDSFAIYYSLDKTQWVEAGTTQLMHFTIENMVPGNTYYVRVYTVYDGIRLSSPWVSVEVTGLDKPPAKVQSFHFEEVRGGLNLSWAANTEPDIKGYNVYQGSGRCGIGLCKKIAETFMGTSLYVPVEGESIITFYIEAVDNRGQISEEPTLLVSELALPPDVTGFYATPHEGRISFRWDDSKAYRYELRHGPDWASGERLTLTAASTAEVYLPLPGTQIFTVKAVNELGNYSQSAAFLSVDLSRQPNRNMIANLDFKEKEWDGVRNNFVIDGSAMVLADQYLQGEYIAPVVLPEEITAGNWVNYHTSILETFFPWDRCNMRWDEAIMPWQEDDDRHPCVAETQIATFQGLGRYLAALELDGSVSGKNTEPKETQHVSYAMGRFHKGIRLGDDVRASWETKIPSVFYLGFNARLQSSIHEHCVFLTLKGEKGFLRLGFDGEFYLLDHLGQKNVVSLEAEPGDIVVFRIEQTESERRLVVRTLSLSRESMDNRAFLPVGEWDEIRLG